MDNKRLIITHKNCTDGCCSQAIFKSKYPKDNYLELDHVNLEIGKDPEAQSYIDYILSHKNSEVFVADFCLPYELTDELLKNGNKVTILDHHHSNIKIVDKFIERKKNGENLNIDIVFDYDNKKSGTMLTWEHIYPGVDPHLAILHVSYGDTWNFELGDRTKHFYAGLLSDYSDPHSVPKEKWLEIVTNEKSGEHYENIGRPLHQKHMDTVHSYASKAMPVNILGKEGLLVEAPRMLTSDLGNVMAKECGGFGLVYYVEDNGIVRCSLRSISPVTVNDLAANFGGGGHNQSAAFRCKDMDEFIQIIGFDPKKQKKLKM